MSQGDSVPPSDAAYLDRRRRALEYAREVQHEVWWSGDHRWKVKQEELTVPALAGLVAVPFDFDDLGPYGDLWLVQNGIISRDSLDEVPESEVLGLRTGNYQTNDPSIFAIFGQDDDTSLDLIQLPTNPSELTLRLSYMKKPPKLLDAGDPNQASFSPVTITRAGAVATVTTATAHGFSNFDQVVISGANEAEYNGTFQILVTSSTTFTYTVTGSPATPATGTITAAEDVASANAALNQIPERFHVRVLLNGLKAKLRESKGDGRWKKYEGDYQAGIRDLKAQVARFQSENRRLPGFFGER
jgi:hypothetical protein